MSKLVLNKSVFNTPVRVTASGEQGTIAGFALNKRDRQKQFLVEYVAADGRNESRWFHEDQLSVA